MTRPSLSTHIYTPNEEWGEDSGKHGANLWFWYRGRGSCGRGESETDRSVEVEMGKSALEGGLWSGSGKFEKAGLQRQNLRGGMFV